MSKRKIKIPKNQLIACNAIIHSASVSAGGVGAGLAQLPLADSALITPIQIGMIIALGKVFKQEISKAAAKAILGGAAAAFAGRGISQLLVGWVPVVGNVINTATAAGITEAVGWLAVDNFSKDAYKDIIAQNPLTEEEQKEKEEKRKSEEKSPDEIKEIKDALKKRAEPFLSGEKSRKEFKEEYKQLLSDIEKLLFDVPVGDEMYEIYNKLADLK